jgi:Homeodomain-like domain
VKTKRFSGLELSVADRAELERMQRSRKPLKVRIWRRVRVLLLLDGGHTVRGTAIAVGGYPREISRVAKRYLQGGLEHALSEDARPKPEHKLDSSQEAAVVALVCGPPPEGQARWSTRLIAEEVSRRGIVDSIGRETVRVMLARRELKPWREKNVVRAGDRPRVRRPNGRRAAIARSSLPGE